MREKAIECKVVVDLKKIEKILKRKISHEEFSKYCKEAIADKIFKGQFEST